MVPSRRVLIVEDNPDGADTLSMLLTLYGFEVEVARTSAEARTRAAAFRPAAAVVDLGLPDCEGADAVRLLTAFTDGPAVVVLTGHTDAARLRAARDAGAKDVVLKPADPEALAGLLGRLVSDRAARLTASS